MQTYENMYNIAEIYLHQIITSYKSFTNKDWYNLQT